jgi:DNA-directed RNA polymerase subunit delta
MKQLSLPETAFAILSKEKDPLKFQELYAKLAAELEMSDDEKGAHIGQFYTDISLDGRFVCLSDNFWDLRSRHSYDKVHIDMDAAYSVGEEAEQDAEDKKENEEYDAAVQGKVVQSEEEEDVQEETEDAAKRKESEEAAKLVGAAGDGSDY